MSLESDLRLALVQSPDDTFIGSLVESVEEHDECSDNPQDAGNGAETMVDYFPHHLALCYIGHIACPAHEKRQQRGAEGHADFVGQGDEGVLETIVADACLPFSILHESGMMA